MPLLPLIGKNKKLNSSKKLCSPKYMAEKNSILKPQCSQQYENVFRCLVVMRDDADDDDDDDRMNIMNNFVWK